MNDAAGLTVRDLTVVRQDGERALDAVSLEVPPGRAVVAVGERNAGVSELTGAVLDLLPDGSHAQGGEVRLGRDDLLSLTPVQRHAIRRARVGAVLARPSSVFDPALTLGSQCRHILVHGAGIGRDDAVGRLVDEARWVGLTRPLHTLSSLPGDVPEGELQRVAVALAAACGSEVVVAQDPTAGLDPIEAADVVDLLGALAHDRGAAVLVATAEPGLAVRIADEVLVLYAGVVHEQGPPLLLDRCRGPYTRALLASMPRLDVPVRPQRATPGSPARPSAMAGGCTFRDRCPFVEQICEAKVPDLVDAGDRQRVRCHFAQERGWDDRLAAYYRAALG